MSETHNLKKLQYDGKEIVAEVAIRDNQGNIITNTYVDKNTDQTIVGRKRFDTTPQIFDHYEITSKNLFRKNFNIFNNIGGTGNTYAYFKLPDDGKNYTLSVRLKDSTKSFGSLNVLGWTTNGGSPGGPVGWLVNGDTINSQYHVFYPNDTARFISLYSGNEATFNKLLERYYVQLEEGTTMTEYVDPDGGVENIYVNVAKVNEIPTNTSDLTNDSDFATHTDLDNYVDLSNEQTITGLKTFTQRPLSNSVYTQLEYIESQATPTVFPYIKTGVRRGTTYSDTESLSCVFDGYFTASQTLGFFGYDGGGQLGQRNGYWSTEGGNSNVSALTRATVLQVINFSGNYDRLYIGGSQIATRAISTAASHSINGDYPLFVAYNGNYTYRPAKARLYSFKMYIGDYYTSPSSCTLIRDFIPAKSPTGEIGLLDLVENKFYANSGTENFIAGPDVTTVTTASPFVITTDVSKVGFSNNYNDLDNKPSIPSVSNVTITLQQNGTTVDSFTLNQGNSKTINFTIPTKTSDLTNDSGFISNTSELENILSAISGYDSTKTQTLKNINGTFM